MSTSLQSRSRFRLGIFIILLRIQRPETIGRRASFFSFVCRVLVGSVVSIRDLLLLLFLLSRGHGGQLHQRFASASSSREMIMTMTIIIVMIIIIVMTTTTMTISRRFLVTTVTNQACQCVIQCLTGRSSLREAGLLIVSFLSLLRCGPGCEPIVRQ